MLTPWLSVSIYPTTLTRLNYLWITLSLGVSACKRFQLFESTAACFYLVCLGFVYTGCKTYKLFLFVCFLTVLVNICDAHQIRCTLCGAGTEDLSLDEDISSVMKRYVFISGNYILLNPPSQNETVLSRPFSGACLFLKRWVSSIANWRRLPVPYFLPAIRPTRRSSTTSCFLRVLLGLAPVATFPTERQWQSKSLLLQPLMQHLELSSFMQ